MAPRKHDKRGKSILQRMLALLMAILLLQMGVYLLVFMQGGVVRQTAKNAFYILSERTANRKLYLENEMLQRWSNTEECESDILAKADHIMQRENITASQLKTDHDLCQELIFDSAGGLVELLRRNGVTGAFFIVDNPDATQNYPGFYVRDYDPTSFSEGNGDLLLERGLPTIARENGIAMDSYWSAFFKLPDGKDPAAEFFFAPLMEAKKESIQNRDSDYYYRWSEPFHLSEMDREVVAYSAPLVLDDGTVLGVLGVDITADYLASQLKYDELAAEKSGAYYLGVSRDGGMSYETVVSSGPNFKAFFGQPKTLSTTFTEHEGVVKMKGNENSAGRTFYAAVKPLKLYNSNTPFVEEQWALLGILESESLLAFPQKIQGLIIFSSLVSLALGMVLIFLAARSLTRPITDLVEHLHRSDPNKPIHLHRLHITEVDSLTEAIENLSNDAAEAASRVSKIIGMTHLPVGVFECQTDIQRVFCSPSLFTILEWDAPIHETAEEWDGENFHLPLEQFRTMLENTLRSQPQAGELVFRLPQVDGSDRWVQLFYREEAQSVLGAFLDVTHDMEAKKKIEYERDYDVLTDLYNRRAFDQRVESLFSEARKGELKIAALMMFDLDNLKYVNDTYGHDYGDRYIQAFAKSLAYFYHYKALVGRRSGDEFNVLLYGYGSEDGIRICTDAFWATIEENSIELPGGESIRVRASGGLAWYPRNAGSYEELMRLADFAMYNIKHTVKGALQEFDRSTYEEKSILIHGQDALNRLIDGKLVRYALQPVVSARDGSVYGYEMLMRPDVVQLEDLEQLFRLARAQSKLQQLEILTWYESLRTFQRLVHAGQVPHGTHVFINSIGNQSLPLRDVQKLEESYQELLSSVVVEITEGEAASTAITVHKREVANRWGAQIAIDDFGTGFNSEGVLISGQPDLVKIDISLIRNIDKDVNKQALVQNLLHYAQARGIKVLGEGVETKEELAQLISYGIDYVQGYYIATPDFEVKPVKAATVAEICRCYQKALWEKQPGEPAKIK